MSDSDSDSSHPRRSDSESEWHRKSSVESTSQVGVNVCPHSVDSIQIDPFAKFGSTPSTRSAHYAGNRGGHVPLEEAESCKGEEFLDTPTLRTPKEVIRLPFRIIVAGSWVEGGDSRGWE